MTPSPRSHVPGNSADMNDEEEEDDATHDGTPAHLKRRRQLASKTVRSQLGRRAAAPQPTPPPSDDASRQQPNAWVVSCHGTSATVVRKRGEDVASTKQQQSKTGVPTHQLLLCESLSQESIDMAKAKLNLNDGTAAATATNVATPTSAVPAAPDLDIDEFMFGMGDVEPPPAAAEGATLQDDDDDHHSAWPTRHPDWVEENFTGKKRKKLPQHALPHPDLAELEFETMEFKDFFLRVGDLVYCPFTPKGSDEEQGYFGYIDRKFKKKNNSRHFSYAIDFDDGDYIEEIWSERLTSAVEVARINEEFRRKRSEMPPHAFPTEKRSGLFSRYGKYKEEEDEKKQAKKKKAPKAISSKSDDTKSTGTFEGPTNTNSVSGEAPNLAPEKPASTAQATPKAASVTPKRKSPSLTDAQPKKKKKPVQPSSEADVTPEHAVADGSKSAPSTPKKSPTKPKPKATKSPPPPAKILSPYDELKTGEVFTNTKHPEWVEAYTGPKRVRLPPLAVPHPDLIELEFETQGFKDFYLRVGDLVYCPFTLETGEEAGYLGYIDDKFKKSNGSRRYTYAIDFDDGDYTEEIDSERLSSVVELARINAEFQRRGSDMPLYKKPKPRSWEFSRRPVQDKPVKAKRKASPVKKAPAKADVDVISESASVLSAREEQSEKAPDAAESVSESAGDDEFTTKPSPPKRGRMKTKPVKKVGPRKKRKKPEPLPGAKKRSLGNKFTGKRYSPPNPTHVDPALREFRFETQQYKDYYLEEGDQVYCPFGPENSYYWGYIDKKYRIPDQTALLYDIDFDDGDYREGIASSEFISIKEWGKIHRLSKYYSLEPPERGTRSWRFSRCRGSQHRSFEEDEKRDDKSPLRPEVEKGPTLADSAESLSLRELVLHRCRVCTNCRRDRCGSCNTCVKKAKPDEVCLQLMCCQLPIECKAQAAPGLPIGWKFYFNSDESNSNQDLRGLVILPPPNQTSTPYQSIEEAIADFADIYEDSEFDANAFYLHVGIGSSSSNKPVLEPKKSPAQKPSKKSAPRSADESKPAGRKHERYSLEDLFNNRCGRCARCRMEDCGKCISCFFNGYSSASSRDVCVRKMCSRIPREKKQQQIEGLPNGWMFSFEDGKGFSHSDTHPDIANLVISSPAGVVYGSMDEFRGRAPDVADLGLANLCEIFGTQLQEEIPNYPIVGRDFSAEWLNGVGETCQAMGKIIKAEISKLDDSVTCTVSFGDIGRGKPDPLLDVKGSVRHPMPKTKPLHEMWAWAGCIRSEKSRRLSNVTSDSPPLNCPKEVQNLEWRVPKIVHANFDDQSGLPSLEMTVDDFKLEFVVKKSTIPQAGYGVYVRCTSMYPSLNDGQHPKFSLPPGRLIDLGVYGPFMENDTKSELLYVAKNYIHSFRPEEYCFESPDGNGFVRQFFDITDDSTGLIHNAARRHITPFVNEIDNPAHHTACVHADYDCQNAMHYLLGHVRSAEGAFELVADGQEKEIFVDYGTGYESIRVRKGYPRCPPDKVDEAKVRLKSTELEYLDMFDSARPSQIKEVVEFLETIFNGRAILDATATSNAVVVLVILKARAKELMSQGPSSASKKTHTPPLDLRNLADRIGKLTEEVFDYLGNDEEMREKLHEHPILLKVIAGDDPDERIRINFMSADEFRPTIVDF